MLWPYSMYGWCHVSERSLNYHCRHFTHFAPFTSTLLQIQGLTSGTTITVGEFEEFGEEGGVPTTITMGHHPPLPVQPLWVATSAALHRPLWRSSSEREWMRRDRNHPQMRTPHTILPFYRYSCLFCTDMVYQRLSFNLFPRLIFQVLFHPSGQLTLTARYS